MEIEDLIEYMWSGETPEEEPIDEKASECRYQFKITGSLLEISDAIAMFKKFFNRGAYKIRFRGRHSDRSSVFKKHNIRPNFDRDVPVRYAESVCVYIEKREKVLK